MKQKKLLGDIFDCWRNGPLLLNNQFPLFQYSQAIFSVSIKSLALTLAQNIHTLMCMLSNADKGGRQFPLFRELLAQKYETIEIGEGHLRFWEEWPTFAH